MLLISLGIFGIFFTYFAICYGLVDGLYLTLLSWSLYILAIPGGHGQLLVGLPVHYFFGKSIYPERFFWLAAFMFNAITFMAYQQIYSKSLITYFFYQLINNPNPNWLVFIFAALGTFYNALFRLSYFSQKPFPHKIVQPALIIVILAIFAYLSHQELIICMNILTH